MSSSIYLAILVMGLLGVVQTAVLPRFPIVGLVPQLPLLVALSWGLLRGVNEGVVWAFTAGFFLDFFSVTPLGLSSVAFMVAVLVVLSLGRVLPTSRLFLPLLQAGLATLLSLMLYFVGWRLFGRALTLSLLSNLLPLAVLHSLLMLPIYWVMLLLERNLHPRPVQI